MMKTVIDLRPYLPQYIAPPAPQAPSRCRRSAGHVLAALEALISLGIGLGFLLMVAAMLSVF